MNQLINKIKCYFSHHLWIEWSHGSDRPSQDFWHPTVMLINPECARCGAEKFKSIHEALAGGCPASIKK